jgi:hypothetical protein
MSFYNLNAAFARDLKAARLCGLSYCWCSTQFPYTMAR